MLFDISSVFFAISNPLLLKMVSKLTNIPKIAIFSNIGVYERVICDTYEGMQGWYWRESNAKAEECSQMSLWIINEVMRN